MKMTLHVTWFIRGSPEVTEVPDTILPLDVIRLIYTPLGFGVSRHRRRRQREDRSFHVRFRRLVGSRLRLYGPWCHRHQLAGPDAAGIRRNPRLEPLAL